MSCVSPVVTLSPQEYDAVLFDLDGVVTRTAAVHAAAWKRLFDDYLKQRAETTGEPFVPFDAGPDYRQYVDGKSRADGIRSFLASRGIDVAEGTPDDQPGFDSLHALGALKNRYFLKHLERHGVAHYDAAVALVRALRADGFRTAVVSSSTNCAAVLEAAEIAGLFDARVDGRDIARLSLAGKPAPDAFLEAARRLDVEPSRAVVAEDAVAGVAAGRAGGFGLVIGVDRGDQAEALRGGGADVVVTGLGQIRVTREPPSAWMLVFDGFDPQAEGIREALCTLGNGYLATRAAVPWARADGVHYPGTYLAGGYNRLRTEIAGRRVENEDLVNFPNWLPLTWRIEGEAWFDARQVTLHDYRLEFDLRRGLLIRTLRFEDAAGRCSRLRERRLVSMSDMHLAAIELSLTAENWSGSATVHSAIDGDVVNAGAELYRPFNNRHLEPVETAELDPESVLLKVRTSQSQLHVAQAARTQAFVVGKRLPAGRRTSRGRGTIAQEFEVELGQGQTLTLEKVVSCYTSRDQAISECGLAARTAVRRAARFGTLLADHELAWEHLWDSFDMQIEPADDDFRLNVPMLLRLNMVHLLQAVSPNSIGLDVGVPARGWSGEAYQGHIFWDELFIFPFFNHRMPEITRSLLMYRYRRLDEARAAAARAGHRGAMFPWQSGSNGQEETQVANLNPRSQRWVPDNSYLQRHVGSAIAYNVWQYFQVVHDIEFLHASGAELILEIARFWCSMAVFDEARERYVIRGVMGPDEFHDAYPDATEPGLDNNAYTNLMAVWVLCRALEVLERLSDLRRRELTKKLRISREEITRWEDVSRRMFVPFHDDGIISQFEGYDRLRELDWEAYRKRYGNIQRLDLILEAEGDTPNHYKLSKQPDVLMLFYLFSAEEIGELFERLGYRFDPEMIPRNIAYYTWRSSQGSTLSRVVYAWVLARSNRPRALEFFTQALQSDVSDIQQGTTAEGIHLGAMAGTVDLVQRVTTGLEVRGDLLRLHPELPRELASLDLRIRYRGHALDLRVLHDCLTVTDRDGGAAPIALCVDGETEQFTSGASRTFELPSDPPE